MMVDLVGVSVNKLVQNRRCRHRLEKEKKGEKQPRGKTFARRSAHRKIWSR